MNLHTVFRLLCLASMYMGAQLSHAQNGDLDHQRPFILATINFPPYVDCSNKQAITGSDTERMRKVFKALSLPLEIRCLPWKRVLQLSEEGKVDGAYPVFYLKQREDFAHYTQPPLHYSRLAIASRPELSANTLADLYKQRVGIEAGFFIHPEFHRRVDAGHFELLEAHSPEQNLRMLQRGRIDAFVDNHKVIKYFIEKLGLKKDIVLSRQFLGETTPSYLMLAKKSSLAMSQASRINKALEQHQ